MSVLRQAAPADETVVERLVRAVVLRRILPLQAVLDDVDDAADYPTVVYPQNAMRQREVRLDPSHLALAQQNKSLIAASCGKP